MRWQDRRPPVTPGHMLLQELRYRRREDVVGHELTDALGAMFGIIGTTAGLAVSAPPTDRCPDCNGSGFCDCCGCADCLRCGGKGVL